MNRVCRYLLGFLLLGLTAVSQDTAMFRGNLVHTGVYNAVGVPKFNQIKWKFHTDGQVISSPAVADGMAFVGSTDGNLYAVDLESGTQKWKLFTGVRVTSSPAVENGVVYFGSYSGRFYAVDAISGKLKWKFQTEGERRFEGKHLHGSEPAAETMPDPFDFYLSSPALWGGAVYFGSGDGNVYALDAATGTLKWRFHTGDVVHASPAISDGTLFIGSWDSYFYALDAASGKEKWRFKTGEDHNIYNQVGIQSSAAVMDGMVYAVAAIRTSMRWMLVPERKNGPSTTRVPGSSLRRQCRMARSTSPLQIPPWFTRWTPKRELPSSRSSSIAGPCFLLPPSQAACSTSVRTRAN